MAQAPRDIFLERAACFAVTNSPSTSTYLMAEKLDSLRTSHAPVSPVLRATCCLACGCLYIPGWTASKHREERRAQSSFAERGRKDKHYTTRKHIIHTCQLCHRKTTIAVQKPTRTKEALALTRSALAETRAEDKAQKSTAKQRAKSRQSKQGLQALMSSRAKQKAVATSSSLDLMDFMKA